MKYQESTYVTVYCAILLSSYFRTGFNTGRITSEQFPGKLSKNCELIPNDKITNSIDFFFFKQITICCSINGIMKFAIFLTILLLSTSNSSALLLSYAICQTGCNAMAVACYAAGGFTFGTGKKVE